MACVDGTVQQLSYDHKPNNDSETKRIVAAGGWVEFNRVNGMLSFALLSVNVCLLYPASTALALYPKPVRKAYELRLYSLSFLEFYHVG